MTTAARAPMGLLVAGFDYSSIAPDEFNEWYDTEHVPQRRAVPGFLNCERWLGADDPKISVATYDLANLAVLESGAYGAIGGDNLSPWSKRVIALSTRICRFEAEQMPPGDGIAPQGAGGVLLVAMNFAPQADSELNAWYEEEHVPRLLRVPGCLAARRFTITRAVSEGRQRYLALYHLESPEVCASLAWQEAVVTPWTLKLRPYMRDMLRLPLRRYAGAPVSP